MSSTNASNRWKVVSDVLSNNVGPVLNKFFVIAGVTATAMVLFSWWTKSCPLRPCFRRVSYEDISSQTDNQQNPEPES